jgi:type VI secretion system secreted protein VgrG
LEGSNIEFKTPGAFTVKGSSHAFLGGGGNGAELTRLPDSTVKLFDEAFALRDPAGKLLSDVSFKITASDGCVVGKSLVDGQTQRLSTKAAEPLKFELRWFDLKM